MRRLQSRSSCPPSVWGKTYLVDGAKAGIFPRTPNDAMIKFLPLPGEPKKAYYLGDWDEAKGYTQPLPFAQGKSIRRRFPMGGADNLLYGIHTSRLRKRQRV